MKKFFMALILMMAIVTSINGLTYNVVDSGNPKCYDNTVEIDCGNAEFPKMAITKGQNSNTRTTGMKLLQMKRRD